MTWDAEETTSVFCGFSADCDSTQTHNTRRRDQTKIAGVVLVTSTYEYAQYEQKEEAYDHPSMTRKQQFVAGGSGTGTLIDSWN